MRFYEFLLREMEQSELVRLKIHTMEKFHSKGYFIRFGNHFLQRGTNGNVDKNGVKRGDTILYQELDQTFDKLFHSKYIKTLFGAQNIGIVGCLVDKEQDIYILFDMAPIAGNRKQGMLNLRTVMKKKGFLIPPECHIIQL